ncbi:Twitching motility protein PilT [Halorhabdus sp. SVX81]|uniref:PIN domain-containing protein n=1 Tax=Halorhabdus sp. SVX81 TaxID=2978283 RepID=UPI0023DB6158|nr:PIN domain-containing protein [Halorhabdus sp. SVX81]WEL18520.1 Twitching motility protein PilT [Halorhabdus sp. SVX81]
MTAVLDTNALMMPVECNVRVFEELDRVIGETDLVVPEAVVAELDRLSDGGGEEATAASVGRDLVERCRVVDHDATNADDAVLELARELEAYAVTNDGPLREALLAADVPVIGLRGRNKLAITQP